MDYLGWIVAIVILFLFGRGGSGFGVSVTGGALGSTNQDTTNTPANQPSPWGGSGCCCGGGGNNTSPSNALPANPVNFFAPVNSPSAALIPPVKMF